MTPNFSPRIFYYNGQTILWTQGEQPAIRSTDIVKSNEELVESVLAVMKEFPLVTQELTRIKCI